MTPSDELEGVLKETVEQIRATPVPADSLRRTLSQAVHTDPRPFRRRVALFATAASVLLCLSVTAIMLYRKSTPHDVQVSQLDPPGSKPDHGTVVGDAKADRCEAPATFKPWAIPHRLPAGGRHPLVTRAQRGCVHIFYVAGDPQKADLFHYSTSGLRQFSKPERVNREAGSVYAPDATCLPQVSSISTDQNVHVAWVGADRKSVYYTMLGADGSFTLPRNVCPAIDEPITGIALAGCDGQLRIFWRTAKQIWEIYANGGHPFTQPTQILPPDKSLDPHVALT